MGPITIERSSYTCQRETIVTESSAPQPEEIITKSSSPAFEEIIAEDGILSLIVSSLTLIEAVRTSVLSSRWRHLWPCLRKFDFNAITVLDVHTLRGCDLDDEEAYNLTKGKTAKFIRSVDSVLQHLQGVRVDEFTVENLPKGLSCFVHLKLLDWEWKENFKMGLFHLATLLGAAPLLQELKLQLSTKSTRVIEQPPETPSKFREILPKTPHTYLKTVRVSGFYFDRWQIEIAAYILNIAPNIQSMTIEKGSKASWFVSNEIDERGMQILRQEAPTEAELVLLVSEV